MSEEKFYKEKSAEQTLKEAVEELNEVKFHMACFVGAFERYSEKIMKND